MLFGNRVKETSQTPGTGTLDLDGAPTGFLAFADEFSNGVEVAYLIVDDPDNPVDWEAGVGTFTAGAPSTLSRDTVEGSSNADNKVSWPAGARTVIATPLAAAHNALFPLYRALTPAQITADQNDYSPAGLASRGALRLASDAARTITGLAGSADGRFKLIHNIGAFAIVLANENASSVAGNRFALGHDVRLLPKESILLQYDSTGQRWRAAATVAHLLDEDNLASNSDTAAPTQQSVKAYVDAAAAANPALTSGAKQDTGSGTAFDFTGLPATVKRIQVVFSLVSLDGADDLLVQIGDAGGIENTGYDSESSTFGVGPSGASVQSTAGYVILLSAASRSVSGIMTLTLIDAATNRWVASFAGAMTAGGNLGIAGGGSKALSATLDRVRLTRAAATGFDGGMVNVLYE